MEVRRTGNSHPRIVVPKSSKRYPALASILKPIQQNGKQKSTKGTAKKQVVSGKTLLEAYKENNWYLVDNSGKSTSKAKRTKSTFGTAVTPPNEQQDMLVTFGSSNFFTRPPLVSSNERGKSLSTCSQGQLESQPSLRKHIVLPTLMRNCEPEQPIFQVEMPQSRKRLVSKLKHLFC